MTYRDDTPPPEWYEPADIVEDLWKGRDIEWVESSFNRAEALGAENGNPYWSYISRLISSQRKTLSERVAVIANDWFMNDEIINTSGDREVFENVDAQHEFGNDIQKVVWFIVSDSRDSNDNLIVPDSVVEEIAEWVAGLREGR
jgi:hypothetical protein